MLVNNTAERFIFGAETKLYPGVNEVDDDAWAKLKKNLGKLVGTEILEIKGEKKNANGKMTEVAISFADATFEQAELIVKQTYNPELLEAWKKSTTQDAVRLLIMNQLDEIKKDNKQK